MHECGWNCRSGLVVQSDPMPRKNMGTLNLFVTAWRAAVPPVFCAPAPAGAATA